MPAKAPKPYSRKWLNSLNLRQRRAVARGPFGRKMHASGCQHMFFLWWFHRARADYAPTTIHHGSGFLLDHGNGPFAVTAAHVVNEYLDHHATGRILGCRIGNVPIDLHNRIIANGRLNEDRGGIDIATFRVTPAEVRQLAKNVVRARGRWPRPPSAGEMIYFGGYPAEQRYMVARGEYSFGAHSVMTSVTSVSSQQIVCRLTRRNFVDVRGEGLPPPDYNLGGISGGPLLVPFYQHGRWTWRLGGVISEAIMKGTNEVVVATRAHHIGSTGRIIP